MSERMTAAVIELASNSVSTLVGRCTADDVETVAQESTSIGLRDSLRATGAIVGKALDAAVEVIADYRELASAHGAGRVIVVAHKTIRDASNREEVLAAIRGATGLEVSVVSGPVVAALAFAGATSGPDRPDTVAVLDVGPGSMEIILGRRRRIAWLTSVPLGGAWLRDEHLRSDPPTAEEVESTSEFLRAYIAQLAIPEVPQTLIATGSVAKMLLRLAQPKLGPETGRMRRTRDDVQAQWDRIAGRTTETLATEHGLSTARARVLPAGILTVLAVMGHTGAVEVALTARGLPHGVLLAHARHGDDWLRHPDVALDPSKVATVPDPLNPRELSRVKPPGARKR